MAFERCTLFSALSSNTTKISGTFSLVDYRNNLYMSNEASRIFDFYESFPDSESLIKWMKERPHGKTTIYEYPGNKDIVVVIPTSNFDGDLAKYSRDVVFKGLHIIFVESGFPKDNYFNYAYSCNVGIRSALQLNPKKIVISNDDMRKIDDVSTLIYEIENSNKDAQVIWTEENNFLEHNFDLLVATVLLRLFMKASKILNIFSKNPKVRTLYLLEKFNIYLTPKYAKSNYNRMSKVLYRVIGTYKVAGHFAIYNSDFIRSQGELLFDETFINGFEDTWLGINIAMKKIVWDIVNYKISPIGGASLGKGNLRYLRDFANLALYNYYVKKNRSTISKINPSHEVNEV